MKRRTLCTALALSLLLLLSACGGQAKGGGSNMSQTQSSSDSADMNFDSMSSSNGGWGYGSEGEMAYPEEPQAEPNSPVGSDSSRVDPLANAKMIYRADLSMETKEFEDSTDGLDRLVEEMGGYYESRTLSQGGDRRRLSATVRVPAEKFESFLTNAGQVAHVTDCGRYADNVSEAYYDIEARLTTQRTKMERLQALLAKAENMEDIISLENAIADTELQIEYLTGDLRHYDSLIGFSTINLTLREVYRLATDTVVPATFGERFTTALGTGLSRGLDGMEEFCISVAENWVTLLILAAVVVGVVQLVRLRRRNKRKALADPTPVKEKEER